MSMKHEHTTTPCPLCKRPILELSDLLITQAINAMDRMIRTTKRNIPGAYCLEEERVLEMMRSELKWRVEMNEHVEAKNG